MTSPAAEIRPAERRETAIVLGLLALNVILWTAYAAISHGSGAIHEDMTEAYVWGREFQLGYYKHPPFWAWIAGVWFLFMPAKAWAFFLLSVLNASIGLLGAWRLNGPFLQGSRRWTATLLLLLTPCYNFLAFKYNANAIFLSLWPWMAYFFVRAIDEGRARDSVAFGVLTAAAMLSKYYAVVLACSCLIAALLHPGRRRYFAGLSPYISIAVAALICAPHAWWLVANDLGPIRYVEGEIRGSLLDGLGDGLRDLVGCVALFAVPVVYILLDRIVRSSSEGRGPAPPIDASRLRFLAALALGPVLFTGLAGAALRVPVANTMSIGVMALLPAFLMQALRSGQGHRLLKATSWSVAAVAGVALLASPFIAYLKVRGGEDDVTQPRIEIAEAATKAWHDETGRPLAIVAGNSPYGDAVAFYSPDHPAEFIGMDFRRSPWITPEMLARKGFLALCLKGNAACIARARGLSAVPGKVLSVKVIHQFRGLAGRPVDFDLFLAPPTASPPVMASRAQA